MSCRKIVVVIFAAALAGAATVFYFLRAGIGPSNVGKDKPIPCPSEVYGIQKLDRLLVALASTVPQRTESLAGSRKVAAPRGFATSSLPEPIRDALNGGFLHINENAEVQVYIVIAKIDDWNLAQLRSLGIAIETLGEPQPNKARGEVLSTVPTVQAELPIMMINQAIALPFICYIRLPDYAFTNG